MNVGDVLRDSTVRLFQSLTFRGEGLCVEVENSSQHGHFLQDDTEAVNVSFLSPTGRGAV